MKKVSLFKLLTLIIAFCSVVCMFTACNNSHIHDYSYTTLAPATCTSEGSMFGVCSCGETTTITVPKIAHTFVNGVCSSCGVSGGSQEQVCAHDWKAADCLNPKTCTKCGATEGEALGHNIKSYDAKEPTCTESGLTTGKTCSTCGEVLLAQEVVPATGHDWREANCLSPKTCSICGEVEGEMGSHNFVNNECVSCGLQATSNEYFNFKLLEDGTYEISAKDVNNMPAEVVIPSSYEGKAVTSIGDYAFGECYSLTSVIIGDSVTSINFGAFALCLGLTSVVLPDNITYIAHGVFACCPLTDIALSKNNENYSIIDGNLYSKDGTVLMQYAIGKTETSFSIPEGVTHIESVAFMYSQNLLFIEIPNSVTSIGDEAFYKCSSLTSVVIGDSVTSIGNYAFYGCSKLQFNEYENCKYLGSESNPYFALIEGVNSNLSSITIHNDARVIANRAFSGYSRLSSIVITDSVTSIGDYAFYNCYSLTSIKYRGTQAQWNAISKDYGWDYGTGDYTVIYNYSEEN